MSAKHFATFLLGVAAGLAATKYMTMTPEEREKMIANLKERANRLKGEAESGFEKAKEFFDDVKERGPDSIKEHFGDVSSFIHNLFKGDKEEKTQQS